MDSQALATQGIGLDYPERSDTNETDWLLVAQRIADLWQPPPNNKASALTDVKRINKLLTKVADGNYMQTALRCAGFSAQTLAVWKDQASNGQLAAIALLEALEKAEAESEAGAVEDVRKAGKAGPQFWAASMTRLERRHPDRWGKRPEDSGTPKVLVQIGVSSGDVKVAIAEAKVPSLTE